MLHAHAFAFGVFAILFSFVFFAGGFVVANGQTLTPSDSHIVSLFVDNQATTNPSRASTVKEFLQNANISLNENDVVEPSLDAEITDDNFRITVFRAKPVTIIDGATIIKLLTPEQSPKLIAQKAGITTYPEDILTLTTANNFVDEQIIGEKLIIKRATPVTISLYGTQAAPYRTHLATVGDLLKEKGITPEEGATLTPNADTPLSENMAIFISKFGKSVITVEEPVDFAIDSTPDPTKTNGVTTIIKPGVKGKKQVIYELNLRDGKEVGRTVIQEVVTVQPVSQTQTKGTKPGAGLTKSKGVLQFIDSFGVQHRETYYDLPMSGVMKNCGAGGLYTVRASDGAKIDKDGFVIIAANLNIYPRCSTVETSIGPGKVYDTGGFALVHPHGFDLATDWSNNDGR